MAAGRTIYLIFTVLPPATACSGRPEAGAARGSVVKAQKEAVLVLSWIQDGHWFQKVLLGTWVRTSTRRVRSRPRGAPREADRRRPGCGAEGPGAGSPSTGLSPGCWVASLWEGASGILLEGGDEISISLRKRVSRHREHGLRRPEVSPQCLAHASRGLCLTPSPAAPPPLQLLPPSDPEAPSWVPAAVPPGTMPPAASWPQSARSDWGPALLTVVTGELTAEPPGDSGTA